MAESPAFRTGYMSLLLPSNTGDLQVHSSIRNMVIDALAATGEWPIRVDVVTSTGSDDGQTKTVSSQQSTTTSSGLGSMASINPMSLGKTGDPLPSRPQQITLIMFRSA